MSGTKTVAVPNSIQMKSPSVDVLVRIDSDHPMHADMFRTLDLLAIDTTGGTAFFVVEGCSEFCDFDELQSRRRYFYEEHTCPVNFIRIPMVSIGGDHDPHGLFRFVRSAWMTTNYVEHDDDYLVRLFPEIAGGSGT